MTRGAFNEVTTLARVLRWTGIAGLRPEATARPALALTGYGNGWPRQFLMGSRLTTI